jgi:hypothetical protein
MFKFLNSKIREANRISRTIENKIGFDGNLVRLGFTYGPDPIPNPTRYVMGFCDDISAENSIYFAILDTLLGNQRRASIIKEEAQKRFGLDGNMIRFQSNAPHIFSFTNEGLGILSYLLGEREKAREIKGDIESRFGFNKGMVIELRNEDYLSNEKAPHSTLGLGILNYLLGEREKAKNLREVIEENIGFEDGMVKDGKGPGKILNGAGTKLIDYKQFNANDNFSFAILDYMLGNEERSRQIGEKTKRTLGEYKGLVISTSMTASHIWAAESALYGIWLLRDRLKERAN